MSKQPTPQGYWFKGEWQPTLPGTPMSGDQVELPGMSFVDDAPVDTSHHWVIPAEGVLDSVECAKCGRQRGIPGLKPTTPEEVFDTTCLAKIKEE